ncbi:hypothetical protein ACJ73_10017 [Blastomyces percursus]|uniref:Uncharacterized protein n=1 Tax=Blastomyces percursus TaxID=1658174 RepID=A0A1J9P129_9EURO|nr:hypothetical protein ACJ73_10017 [Blastomyces percursus]
MGKVPDVGEEWEGNWQQASVAAGRDRQSLFQPQRSPGLKNQQALAAAAAGMLREAQLWFTNGWRPMKSPCPPLY